MPYAKLFRSRWAAILWAGGILWTAADFVGFKSAQPATAANATEVDATGADVDANDLAILANVMNGK
ncbi:hypothetical protein BH10PSE15_BH10PSE15_12170 [soil metagenome]